MRHIKSVLVVTSVMQKRARVYARKIIDYFLDRGVRCDLLPLKDLDRSDTTRHYDLAITLGGDGTVLCASRILSPHSTPILPINLGTFGFITEIEASEWQEAIEQYETGTLVVATRILLEVTVLRDKSELHRFVGLNEAVISSSGVAKLVNLSVSIRDQVLGAYRADGLIIATPTGSTAYSVAAGGPVLHPEMDAFIINPVCPFTLSHRPLVVPGNELLTVHIAENQRTEIIVTVDGQKAIPLQPNDTLTISSYNERAHIIRSPNRNFYDILCGKLGWGEAL